MASKLRVDELRAELTKRGLDASGTKPKLVERLAAVLLEESKGKTQSDGDLGDDNKRKSRKRTRESQDDDDDDDGEEEEEEDEEDGGVVVDVETLRGMGVRELREQATIRGVSTKGNKKEILERLCAADLNKDSGGSITQTQDKGKASVAKEEKLVKATKKGVAVLDEYLPDNIKANYHVLEHGGEIYDSMLNQTNISDNNNKFYVIQALESDSGGAFMVFTRWGRVGVKGMIKLQGPYTSRDEAIQEFEQKFFAKTKNDWSERKNFVCHPKLYTWLEMDYKETENEPVVPKKLKDPSVQGRKRPRESQDDDDGDDDCDVVTDGKTKKDEEDGVVIVDVETLRGMGVRELREQASIRGVSTKGNKKEIFERLSADLKKDSGGSITQVVDKGKASKGKEEKLVKATKKGAAVLDQYLPEDIKANYHVLEHDGEIFDAMLNQTNVSDNNNKFYVIQVLESDSGGAFMVFARWGRVGVKGQNKLQGPFTSRDEAIEEFEQKFYAKTKNLWSDRKNFVCYPKLYTWLEMDYKETENESVVPKKLKDSSIQPQESKPSESKLESRIANFISLICNVTMMKQQMVEIGYNAEKLPLGKLSKSTILKGYNVLKSIAEAMAANPDRKTLEQLTGAFYTVIPHDFGFKKMREFIIDTPQKLKSKIEMVEALGEIELATKLLKDVDDIHMDDPLYSHYNQLRCDLKAIDTDSKEYSLIERYMKNTHASTHSSYTVDIVQLFRVSRKSEDERFRKFSNTKNRMLLWHGSRLTNWTGILSQGLRIAPPEAPCTGYMFGKGVYFADMFSKSANYCCSSSSSRDGVLLLCEVALGEMAELLNADYNADKLPEGKLSTKGVGSTAPDPSEYQALDDGVVVPLGKPKVHRDRASLLYNEYIVYNVDQIRMRYLIHVKFNYNRNW